MRAADGLSGVWCPVVTPFRENLSPDHGLFTAHCHWLFDQGVGLAVLGTNSEANSLSVAEKTELLGALELEGIEMSRVMPGTGSCALTDTVALTRAAVELGCGAVLMLPPFYYKAVSDDGLFAYFAEVIERVADRRLRICLYHIPPIAQVGISPALIQRLIETYPSAIAGIKDSSGDWSFTEALHARQWPDFSVFVGSDALLLKNMRAGGAGCISAAVNVNPAAIKALYENWRAGDADDAQHALTELRSLLERYPMIAAMKSVIAAFSEVPGWRRVRPPLSELAADDEQSLLESLSALGFSMPGLAGKC